MAWAPLGCAWLMLLAGMAGCTAGKGGAATGNRFVVKTPQTAFYRLGPAQGTPPDATLATGEKLTVLERAHGFSRVALANGQTGYVVSEALRALLPEPPPARPAGGRGGGQSSRERGGQRPPASGEPLFEPLDLPVPGSEGSPPPAPKPRFRF